MSTTDADDGYAEWPYATTYLLNTLDPELIEAHAVHILSRALNIGRVIGFIDAGAPMSYGRISWQDLVPTEIERVDPSADLSLRHCNELGDVFEVGRTEVDRARRLARRARQSTEARNPRTCSGPPNRRCAAASDRRNWLGLMLRRRSAG